MKGRNDSQCLLLLLLAFAFHKELYSLETSTDNFVANIENNPKEECNVIFIRSQRIEDTEREKRSKGVLEYVSNEEGENKKREEG